MNVQELFSKPRFLFDGGMGTQLQARGLKGGHCPETLNLSNPDDIAAVHKDYAAVGAMAVETNTLGGNAIKLAKAGELDRLHDINRRAIEIIRDALGDSVAAALSVGPTGEFLAPFGDLDYPTLYNAFAAQMKAADNADVFYIETQCDLAETRTAMLAAASETQVPFVASFTFENGRTLMGNTPEVCGYSAERLGAAAVGINCSGGPEQLLPAVKAMRKVTSLPLIVQPNAGLPFVENGETRFPFAAEEMAQAMRGILDAGADGIGGCCGTTPAHIAAMHRLLAEYGPVQRPAAGRFLATLRALVPLEDALEEVYTFTAREDCETADLDDAGMDAMDEESTALKLDLSALTPEAITGVLNDANLPARLPILFAVRTQAQAEAALCAYRGIAGITASEDISAAARKYGAFIL